MLLFASPLERTTDFRRKPVLKPAGTVRALYASAWHICCRRSGERYELPQEVFHIAVCWAIMCLTPIEASPEGDGSLLKKADCIAVYLYRKVCSALATGLRSFEMVSRLPQEWEVYEY